MIDWLSMYVGGTVSCLHLKEESDLETVSMAAIKRCENTGEQYLSLLIFLSDIHFFNCHNCHNSHN